MSNFSTLLHGALLPSPCGARHDAVAITDADGPTNWGTLRRRALAAAARLWTERAAGVAGPRVAILVDPGADWLASYLGVVLAGAVAVPLSGRYTDREFALLMDDADASAIVCDAASPARALGRPRIDVDDLLAPHAATDATALRPPSDDDIAMLLYTSGTTGRPKGVVLRHRHLSHQIHSLIACWRLDERRALLHALPLHHMHGIAIALLPCLCAGMRVVMLPRFDAVAIWEALAACDTFMAVPTMLHRLVEAYDAADDATRSRWRAAAQSALTISGSAGLPVALGERWRAIAGSLPLERWGMTELGVGCSNPLEPGDRRAGWVGTPLVDVRVVDGELWVRGPGVFDGYWQRPDADAEAFAAGWFRTGDAVEQRERWLRILGRRSLDIIKSGGNKISALEIEEQLRGHEAIEDVAVVGVVDPIHGEQVVAAIVLRRHIDAARVDPEALAAWARARLAPYKVPRRFAIVAELPRNALGKLLKRELAAQLAGSEG